MRTYPTQYVCIPFAEEMDYFGLGPPRLSFQIVSLTYIMGGGATIE